MPIAGGARFRAALTVAGGAAGFVVPPEVVTDLGGGPSPAVLATVLLATALPGTVLQGTVARYRFPAAIQRRQDRYWLAADPDLGVGREFVVEVELDLPVRASRAWRLGRRGRSGCRRPRRP
jgi:hypothetical protein